MTPRASSPTLQIGQSMDAPGHRLSVPVSTPVLTLVVGERSQKTAEAFFRKNLCGQLHLTEKHERP
jgi:hypothetical protein